VEPFFAGAVHDSPFNFVALQIAMLTGLQLTPTEKPVSFCSQNELTFNK